MSYDPRVDSLEKNYENLKANLEELLDATKQMSQREDRLISLIENIVDGAGSQALMTVNFAILLLSLIEDMQSGKPEGIEKIRQLTQDLKEQRDRLTIGLAKHEAPGAGE